MADYWSPGPSGGRSSSIRLRPPDVLKRGARSDAALSWRRSRAPQGRTLGRKRRFQETREFREGAVPSASKGRPLERPKAPETEAGMGTITDVSKNHFATNVINIFHISYTFLCCYK